MDLNRRMVGGAGVLSLDNQLNQWNPLRTIVNRPDELVERVGE
jgi:hypothetical protein